MMTEAGEYKFEATQSYIELMPNLGYRETL